MLARYRAFSRGTVHAALPGKDSNDRSSANVSATTKKNYAVVAKEMAKTQSLEASFRNISHYLSLIERARNTIQGVEAKLTELDVTVSEAAGLIDSDDYNSVSVGAIAWPALPALPADPVHLPQFRRRPQAAKGPDLHSQSAPTAPAIMKSSISMPMARAMRLMT